MVATLSGPPVVSDRVLARQHRGELSPAQVSAFREFLADVERELLHHRVIVENRYTAWFADGRASDAELRHFVRQFSVFSNQFLVAALLKVINAPSLDQARAGKQILLNELGVIYRKPGPEARREVAEADKDREGDPELVGTEGTVDGGTFRFRAAHFEWLLRIGEYLGMGFDDLGKRRHGRPTTLRFCDELQRTYGSEDPAFAEGASFAVENWAAAGFWQELEDGLSHLKRTRHPGLPLAFFTWHNRVEAQHAGHTMEELEEVFFRPGFDRDRFLEGGRQALDAVALFWDGLESDRVGGVTA
jgi:hypothetical protein